MPKQQSQKKQTQLLVLLLIMFACVTAYSFKDRLDIPTESTIKGLRAHLASRRAELQKVTEEADKFKATIEATQQEFELLKYNPTLERDAQAKFDRILDDSNVTKTKSTVNAIQNRGKSSLQQVHINVEFDDFSMRKLCDLFETFGMKALNGNAPLYWTKITISTRNVGRRATPQMTRRPPGQPTPPPPSAANADNTGKRQLSVSATATAYTLYPNASDLIFSDIFKSEAQGGAADKSPNGGKSSVRTKTTTPVKGGQK